MYAALITGPSTAVSRWSSFFICRQIFFFFYPTVGALLPPPDMITRTEAKETLSPPPPPNTHTSLLLRVSYSLSLICQPDIRGHKAHIINMYELGGKIIQLILASDSPFTPLPPTHKKASHSKSGDTDAHPQCSP